MLSARSAPASNGPAQGKNQDAHALWLLRERALALVSDALATRNLTGVLVKGAALALSIYDHPWERDMGDIDLLVDDVDGARAALLEVGCREVPLSRRLTAADLGARVLVLPVGSLEVPIDLHARLDKVVSRPVDYGAILARSVPTKFAALRVPDPVDHALLIVLHAATAEFTHVACWRDLQLLFTEGFDYPAFAGRARAWRLATAAWMTLHKLRSRGVLTHDSRLQEIIRQLRPPLLRRQLTVSLHRVARPRQLGWRWSLGQAPLRDDTFNWLAGMVRYAGRRVLERTLLR